MNGPHKGKGDDRVVPFRRSPPKTPQQWRKPLRLFAVLFALSLFVSAVYRGAIPGLEELIFALMFAGALAGADLYRRRRGGI